ncbi:MAG: hypothetical protein EDQ89_10190 [Acidobacteria bacterium]|nr:MAG: hypothetical protein EDQ89_10190 [Acidobacteriota bacterium]GIK77727.1 MAG: hypothetical protein BroJett022_14170 [Actinomycetes bacterium]
MSERPSARVAVRSYRGVVDEVERRIFRLDRWRLPTPHGVPVRGVGYALAWLLVLLLASGLPLVGPLLGLLPDSLRLLAVPALGGWAMASLRIDGRPPHRMLFAAARYLASPRTLSGLRCCPPAGAELAPVEAVEIAAVGDGPTLRAGRVRGPARLTLRYPARARAEGGRGGEGRDRLAAARRLTLSAAGEWRGPLARARTLTVPAGREVRVR